MPRCVCTTPCKCFILPDGYDNSGILNNNTTTVVGDGSEDHPFVVKSLYGANYVPAGVVVKSTTVNPPNTALNIPFALVKDTDGMFNAAQPDRITINQSGLYIIGASIIWNDDIVIPRTDFRLTINGSITFMPTGRSQNRTLVSNAPIPTTVGGIISRLTVSPAQFGLVPGDYLQVAVGATDNPGSIGATLWAIFA